MMSMIEDSGTENKIPLHRKQPTSIVRACVIVVGGTTILLAFVVYLWMMGTYSPLKELKGRVVFTNLATDGSYDSQIFLLDETLKPYPFTDPNTSSFDPTVSPDNEHIAYISFGPSEDGIANLFVMTSDGKSRVESKEQPTP